jgi:hypothetical protein
VPALLQSRSGNAAGKQRAVGNPKLADDFGNGQVAVEALLAGLAK